jgi:hypothetical protein
MDELANLAIRPATMVQTAAPAGCANRYMLIEGVARLGDLIPCQPCDRPHEVLDLLELGIAATVEIAQTESTARAATSTNGRPSDGS